MPIQTDFKAQVFSSLIIRRRVADNSNGGVEISANNLISEFTMGHHTPLWPISKVKAQYLYWGATTGQAMGWMNRQHRALFIVVEFYA
jgi:hypothetical protein